jgi:hypothetical protein
LPSIRKKIKHRLGNTELPKLDEDLEMLYKLRVPIDRALRPSTFAEMKKNKIVPKGYTTHSDLDELASIAIFEVLKQKYPKQFEMLEKIPLEPERPATETWSKKFMCRVVAFNNHFEQAIMAKQIQLDYKNQLEIEIGIETAASKKAQLDYKNQLAKFWAENDELGSMHIRLAENIKKKGDEQFKQAQQKGTQQKAAESH